MSDSLILTARRSTFASILRFDGLPRNPWTTALSPSFFKPYSSRCTCRTLNFSSSAASRCVIRFFFAFFNADCEPLAFIIPAGEWAPLWSKMIDTGSEADPDEALYEVGEDLKVQSRSLVILQRA